MIETEGQDPLNLFQGLEIPEKVNVYCSCCPNELLDFIFQSNEHKIPIISNFEVVNLKAEDEMVQDWNDDWVNYMFSGGEVKGLDYSDH